MYYNALWKIGNAGKIYKNGYNVGAICILLYGRKY